MPGKGARNIISDNPAATAKKFYDILGDGGEFRPIPGKGYMKWFEDGTHVTYRPISHSKDKSPVFEVTVESPGTALAPYQRIHFVRDRAR